MKKLFSVPVLLALASGCLVAALVTSLAIYWFVVPKLPAIESLRDVKLQVPLKVYTKDHIRHERVLDVYVNYVSLDSIHASGPSTITGRSILKTDNLKIKASISAEIKLQTQVDSLRLILNNAANVQLAGSASYFDLLITEVSDLMAYNLISQHCNAKLNTDNQNPGIARIHVEKTLDVTIKGPRFLYYKGNAEVTNQIIEGSGNVVKY